MNRTLALALVVALLAGSPLCAALAAQDPGGGGRNRANAGQKVRAAGDRKNRGNGPRIPPLADITVTGQVSKVEQPGKNGQARARYVLTESRGASFALASGRVGGRKRGQVHVAPIIDLARYVGKTVIVTGQAPADGKNGRKRRLVRVTRVEEAPAAG